MKTLFAYISILSLVLPCAALAQVDGEDSAQSMEEVVVSGQFLYSDTVNALKTPTPILDVPQSLSLMTADDIRDRGFNSVGEIVAYMPGVTTSQGEGHRDAVVFRGVRSTADFYIDGVRDDVQYYRPLYNLEQVEVLRGPNALLFGRGGTGGVLNRVTKKAVLDRQFTQAVFNIDSLGEMGGQLDYNTGLSDSTAFRLNAMVERLENHRDYYDGDRLVSTLHCISRRRTVRSTSPMSTSTTSDLSTEVCLRVPMADPSRRSRTSFLVTPR